MCKGGIIKTGAGVKFSKQVKLTHLETGEVRVFGSQHSACKELKIHPWALKEVIKGNNSHAKGWKAESLNEVSKEDWDKLDKHTTSINLRCPECGKYFWLKNNKNNRKNRFCSNVCRRNSYKKYAKNGMLQRNEDGNLLCYDCLNYKVEDDFSVYTGAQFAEIRNGRTSRCRDCQKVASKRSRVKSKNDLTYILRTRLICAKTSSNKRKVYFDKTLTYKDLLEIYNIQKGICPISKQVLAINTDKTPYTISLDRKDSSKGYTKENIHLVCWAVNQMKNNFSLSELVKWCNFIVYNNKEELIKINN